MPGPSRPDPTLALHECLTIAARLDATVTELMRLAREPRRTQRLPVGALLDRIRTNWHGPLANTGRRLHLPAAPPDIDAFASAAAIGHALDILLDNAFHHGRGTVTVTVDAAAIAGGLVLSVTDEGTGPAATHVHGTSTTRDGHGIGLELATTLIEAEGGRLRRPTPAHPATFAIVLATTTTTSTRTLTP